VREQRVVRGEQELGEAQLVARARAAPGSGPAPRNTCGSLSGIQCFTRSPSRFAISVA
jgi:hypothetical protein